MKNHTQASSLICAKVVVAEVQFSNLKHKILWNIRSQIRI